MKTKTSTTHWLYLVIIVVILFLYSSRFIVSEGQQALILRLGTLKKDAQGQIQVIKPGFHLKIPFIMKALIFDTRIQNLDIESSRIVTAEKKDVLVDYYVKWRITNLAHFYKSTGGDTLRANILLQQQVNNNLRAQFGKRTISEVVSDDRSAVMLSLRQQANKSAAPLGIDIIDVRIKAIDLPREVSSAVFSRMRAERQRVATEHRANGKSLAEAIRATADATATIILATANREAAETRASGNQEAADIYAKTYNQDPEFYAFYRSLQAYRNTFKHKSDIMVLGSDSSFFKYMKLLPSK